MREPNIIAETGRVYLREFVPEDVKHLQGTNEDPEVICSTGDTAFTDKEVSGKLLKNCDEFRKNGFGRWAVIRKVDDEFLGWCGFKFHPVEAIVEVEYCLYEKYWGQNYATEVIKASVNYGFCELKLAKIYARIHHSNMASLKVVEECGFQYLKNFDYCGIWGPLFVLVNPDITIKKIAAVETYTVRHPVLRPGRPVEACSFEGDELDTTIHLGAFFGGRLIGVVTLMKSGDNMYQLRGMAVLEEFQKKGVGEDLVLHGEEEVRNRGVGVIWMNARDTAFSFYNRLGYKIIGEKFNIPLIGGHYKMKKEL